jgi:hypothetical protein
VVPLAQREVIDAEDRGAAAASGTGTAMTSRIIEARPGAAPPRAAASRAPARPPSATAIAVSAARAGGVRREYREARPSGCSANVSAGQSGSWQKSRRAVSRISTSRPPAGTSRSHRW